MTRVKRGLVTLACVLVASVLASGRAAHATSIQPGDYMRSGPQACTLGFVVGDATDTYFLTAAHCVEPNAPVQTIDGTVFGFAVAEGSAAEVPGLEQDWALIKVHAHMVGSVVPTVRGAPGAPRGVEAASESGPGDLIRHSGYGIGFEILPLTRQQRYGVLTYQDGGSWESIGMDVNGDSGGPVVHASSGGALGLVSRGCLGLCTSSGPTIEGILQQAAGVGYPLTLRTG